MTTKFIHDNFILDLSNHEFTLNEENNWFTSSVYFRYSYPLDINITDEQHRDLSYILEEFIENRVTVWWGRFYVLNEVHEGQLEIIKLKGRNLTIQINYGYEELPNGQKMLSELPLYYRKLGPSENLFDVASSEVNNSWPLHNYAWHRVNTDRLDKDSPQWEFFQGAINNYDKTSGAMLENEYDELEDLQINRNILQPIPYALHVLKAGFEDAGYTLQGEVLELPVLKKTTVFHFSKYYSSFNEQKQELVVKGNEWTTLFHPECALYDHIIYLPEPGRYTIAGNFMLRATPDTQPTLPSQVGHAWAEIGFVPGVGSPLQQLWRHDRYCTPFYQYREWHKSMDYTFDYYGTGGFIVVTVQSLPWAKVDETIVEDPMTIDLTLSQRAKYDSNGDLLPTLIVPDEIHLQKCVPQMNFGDFVQMFLKLRNLDIDIDETNKVVKINRILPRINNQTPISLSDKEVIEPEIEFNQGKKYLLKYQDVDHEDYKYQQVLVSVDGAEFGAFESDPEIEEIVINALPLPRVVRNSALTAYDFMEDDSRAFLCLYEGLDADGNNYTEDPEPLLIPAIYEAEYKDWIEFLLRGMGYSWSFDTFFEETLKLKIKSVIYAYQKRHVVKRISRSNISPDVIFCEIETKTLD